MVLNNGPGRGITKLSKTLVEKQIWLGLRSQTIEWHLHFTSYLVLRYCAVCFGVSLTRVALILSFQECFLCSNGLTHTLWDPYLWIKTGLFLHTLCCIELVHNFCKTCWRWRKNIFLASLSQETTGIPFSSRGLGLFNVLSSPMGTWQGEKAREHSVLTASNSPGSLKRSLLTFHMRLWGPIQREIHAL